MQRLQWHLQMACGLGTPDTVGLVHACLNSLSLDQVRVMLKQPVRNRGSILLGELVAIKTALQHIHRCTCKAQRGTTISKAHIFSDSQSAVGLLNLGWDASSHKTTAQEVESEIRKLEKSEVSLQISWTPGHANINGNECMDMLAKRGSTGGKGKRESATSVILWRRERSSKEVRVCQMAENVGKVREGQTFV